jgi:hypothetical protein
MQLLVELGHREPVAELEGGGLTRVRRDDQAVIDEVEDDLERDAVRRPQPARGQATHTDVERGVPPVVSRRRRCHPYLADDLHPEVQRLLRRLPFREGQRGELDPAGCGRRHGVTPSFARLSGHATSPVITAPWHLLSRLHAHLLGRREPRHQVGALGGKRELGR